MRSSIEPQEAEETSSIPVVCTQVPPTPPTPYTQNLESRKAVEHGINRGIGRKGCPAGRKQGYHITITRTLQAIILEGPQQTDKFCRRGLEQHVHPLA